MGLSVGVGSAVVDGFAVGLSGDGESDGDVDCDDTCDC